LRSTVLPGTTEHIVLPILEQASRRRAGTDFTVAYNPKFERGSAYRTSGNHPTPFSARGTLRISPRSVNSTNRRREKSSKPNPFAEMAKYESNAFQL
jgi:UDP-glucose/GDP-mannose dehydrogenase family protein